MAGGLSRTGLARILQMRQSPNAKSRPPQARREAPAHVNFMGQRDPQTLRRRML
jgi:hypothetical protein